VPVESLYDPFKNLLSFYQPAECSPLEPGTPIIELVQGDWEVFSDRLCDLNREGRLLEAIMASLWDDDSGQPPLGSSDSYVRKQDHWSHDTLEGIWQEFADNVKSDPTHALEFRGGDFDSFLMDEEIPGRRTVRYPVDTVLYRARLGFVPGTDGDEPYSGGGHRCPAG
jgi:hypothetical protein